MTDLTVKGNILIVDDTPANLRLLSNMLTEQGYKVRAVVNGQMALTTTRAIPPDLILLDINMPGMNGYEVCQRLKMDEETRPIPIIFISALDEVQDKVKAFTVGGVDYITKPFQFEEVLARVETHLSLCRLQKELGQEIIARDKLIAELDAYAHTVAHDLKNPLTALIGFSELMVERYDKMPPEQIERNLRVISENGRRMTNIIEELLLLASVRQRGQVPMEPVDMAHVVSEVQARLADMIRRNNAELVIPDTWPVALGHGPWIEEVWTNYISNAIKYGGTPPRVELGATPKEDGYMRFWVRDNGAGITQEDQVRLFTPFERLSQVRIEGHGLGLSIVQRIVEKLGGYVSVTSAPGEGSTFNFCLPTPEDGKPA
ncbi:MAG: hybrid sensor histidine kinase/response regulator [Anaerolineae bacterium]|nr:hybrid sensor histidine kinase/response regulator [Anaerolineae bacterium]